MKEIFVRLDRCMGCQSCELACAVEHSVTKDLYGAIKEKPIPRKRLFLKYVPDKPVPLLCRHCDDAPCVRVCCTSSLKQDTITHIVSHNTKTCIGCWMCSMACPYGMIGRELEKRVAIKCDRCPNRESPACVDSCPTGALVFIEESEYADLKRHETAVNMAK